MSAGAVEDVTPAQAVEATRRIADGQVLATPRAVATAKALLAERESVRLAAMNLLRRLDKMGGTVTEGHSRKCNVWKGGQCGCSIAQHIRALQEAVGYGA